MPVTAVFSRVSRGQEFRNFLFTAEMILSGDYETGGFLAIRSDAVLRPPTTKSPISVEIKGTAGYTFEYDPVTEKTRIRQSAAAGNPQGELAAAALPAGITNDRMSVVVRYPKFG